MPAAPETAVRVQPASIRQAAHLQPVRPAATLAAPAGTLEADEAADLRPVAGIAGAQFAADRHDAGSGNRVLCLACAAGLYKDGGQKTAAASLMIASHRPADSATISNSANPFGKGPVAPLAAPAGRT